MSKIEVYNKFVKKVASIFEKTKGLLVTISIIVFGVLACVVSDAIILIMFVPFVYQVMKALEIDKKVILSSTIIASLVGAMCGIYNGTLFSLLSLEVNTLLLVKVILLVICLAILIFFTAPKNVKKEKNVVKNETKASVKSETKKVEKKDTKKSTSTKTSTAKKTSTTKKTTKKATGRKKVAK